MRYVNPRDIIAMRSMFALFALIGYVAEVALGIPLLLLFRWLGLSELLWFLLGGLVIGVIVWVGLLILASFTDSFHLDDPFIPVLLLGILGCIAPAIISAGVFWFLGWSADNKSLDARREGVFRN